jgi:hypothetical protein
MVAITKYDLQRRSMTSEFILEMIVELRADDKANRVAMCASLPIGEEKRLATPIVDLVRPLLDTNDALSECVEASGVVADRAEKRHRLQHQVRGLQNDIAHLLHLRFEGAHLEQGDGFGGLVHLIDGVVHHGREALDVGAVEGGDEAAAHRRQDLARDLVGLGLRSNICLQ